MKNYLFLSFACCAAIDCKTRIVWLIVKPIFEITEMTIISSSLLAKVTMFSEQEFSPSSNFHLIMEAHDI